MVHWIYRVVGPRYFIGIAALSVTVGVFLVVRGLVTVRPVTYETGILFFIPAVLAIVYIPRARVLVAQYRVASRKGSKGKDGSV